jgi:hypothetical protein
MHQHGEMSLSQRNALLVLGGTFKQERFFWEPVRAGLNLLIIDEVGRAARLNEVAAKREHPLFGALIAGISPDDTSSALATVASWQETFHIRGVLVVREPFVVTGGVVAEVLGLPAPGLRAATVCRNKLAQRQLAGFAAPGWVCLSPGGAHARLNRLPPGPVVVKSLTGAGSAGVAMADSPRDALPRVEAGETVLVEEMIEGREVSLESIVVGSEIVFTGVTRKEVSADGQFVETAHTVGPGNDGLPMADLLALHQRVLAALRFDTGMPHAEYKIAPDGRVVLMEIAARPAGDGILSLYTLAGSSPLEATLLAALTGETVTAPVLHRFARQRYLQHDDGILADVHAPSDVPSRWYHEEQRGIYLDVVPTGAGAEYRIAFTEKRKGQRLTPVLTSGDRATSVLFDAPALTDLDRLDRMVPELFSVRTEKRAGG